MSWYSLKGELQPREVKYCNLIQETFYVRSPLGDPIPYEMTDYQKSWHCESINILGDEATDLLIIKARGISFTYSFMIDYILTALSFTNQLLQIGRAHV